MITPQQADEFFFTNLPWGSDMVFLDRGRGAWEYWNSTTSEERAAIHQEFETYAALVTQLKISS